MSGGQIKNVLTLDVSKFNEAIDKATANLGALDKQLKSAGKMAADFEKNFASVGGDVASISDKFKLLDQSISTLVSRLDKAGGSGLDGFSSKARRAKKDIEGLEKATGNTGGTLLNLTDWFGRYGKAIEKINPAIDEVIAGQRNLRKEAAKTMGDLKEANEQQIAARVKSLEAEKVANAETVKSRAKMVSDLKALEKDLASQQQQFESNASRYFGKNAGKGDAYRSRAAELQQDRAIIAQQLRTIEGLNEALVKENAHIQHIIDLHQDQLLVVKRVAAEEEAAANAAIEAEHLRTAAMERRKELLDYMAAQERRLAAESMKAGKLAERIVAQQSQPGYKAAGPAWWEAQFAARKAAQDAFEKEQAASEARIAKQAKRIVQENTSDGYKNAGPKWWEEQLAAREKAEKDAADAAIKEANRAHRERLAAMREEQAEARRTAQARLESERETARQIAQMWKGMGQLWAASKIENGLKAGVGEASKYQQADMRLKLLNLSPAENDEFRAKSKALANQEGYLSETEALKARTDALTAMGHNDPKMIDATLTSAVRNAQVLMSAGYEQGDRSDIVKNLYGFAEARQVMSDPEKVKESFDIVRRMAQVSGGKIGVADMETVARNMGDLRQTMSADGWMGVASLMEQFKVAGSHGAGGAGAGVSSVGTILKMMSLYAAGKPVTDQAALQLLGAGVMNDPTQMEGTDLKEMAKTNTQMRRMIKTAGFKGAEDMAANPVEFFSGLRGQILDYTKSDENKGKFYKPGGDMNDPAAESAAMKQFFAKTGMSQKTVDGMLLMMDKGFIERSKHVQELAKNAADEQKAVEEMKKTWSNAVSEMDAGASKLATAFTPLLEPLAAIPRAIGQILTKAAEFVSDNPLLGAANLAAVAFGGLVLGVKGALSTFGMVGGVIGGVRTILGTGAAAVEASTVAWGGVQRMLATLALAFPNVTAVAAAAFETVWGWGTRLAAPFVGLAEVLLAPFASVAAGATGALGLLGTLGTTLLGFVARWASPAGWLALAGQFGWVIGKWVSDLKVGGITIGDHMQNIFLSIEVGWKNTLLNAKGLWNDFMSFLDGGIGSEARDKELAAERKKLAEYKKSMEAKAPPAPPPAAPPQDGHGSNDKKEDAKATGGVPAVVANAFGGKPNRGGTQERGAFENAFARQFYSADSRAAIEQLKLDSLNTGEANYAERARQEVIKMWMGGDLDDGKDAKKRKFVKGSTTDKNGNTLVGGKGYDPLKGYGVDQMDWEAQASVGGNEKRSLTDLQNEIAERLKLADTIKAVSFAKERARASDADLSAAMERLTDNTAGQTDAMKALNREFAQQEARNPSVKDNLDYQASKRAALNNRAASDYANMGADLRSKNEELAAGFLPTERERIEAAAKAQYDAERKKVDAVRKSLDDRLAAMREAGLQESEEYAGIVQARKAAEADFNRYLELIQKQREEALLTPIQKMAREWKDTYAQLQSAQVSWSNSFVDNLTKVISGGKANWKDFARTILEDLAKIALKRAMALGADAMFGQAGFSGVAGAAINGGGVAAGGIAGGLLNNMRGVSDKYALGPNAGPQMPAGMMPDVATSDVEGMAPDAANALAESMKNADEAVQMLTVAHNAQQMAVEAGTLATTTDTAATEASAIATATDTTATQADAIATAFDATATDASAAATIYNTGTEWAEAAANEYAAATEYAANGAAFSGSAAFFANGGAFTNQVVSQPTAFSFGHNDLGVMGEAGPEAILPLSRDGSGRLGVTINGGSTGGGAAVTIQINVDNKGNGSVASTGDSAGDWTKMANRVRGVVLEELTNQQRPGGALYR